MEFRIRKTKFLFFFDRYFAEVNYKHGFFTEPRWTIAKSYFNYLKALKYCNRHGIFTYFTEDLK